MMLSRRSSLLRSLAVLAVVGSLAAACGDDDDAADDAPQDTTGDTGGGTGGQEEPAEGGDEPYDLTVALSSGWAALDPHESPEINTQNTIGPVYETLVRRNTDGPALEPALARGDR